MGRRGASGKQQQWPDNGGSSEGKGQQRQQQQQQYPGHQQHQEYGVKGGGVGSTGRKGKGGYKGRGAGGRASGERQTPPHLIADPPPSRLAQPENAGQPSLSLPSAAFGPPSQSGLPSAFENAGGIIPITPLGLPKTPPALPPFPGADAFETLPVLTLPLSIDEALDGQDGTEAEKEEEAWTPLASQIARGSDRRTFFHTTGKSLTFHATQDKKVNTEVHVDIGERVILNVEEVHFGNPRISAMKGEPGPMPQMLKWSKDMFDDYVLQCAQISFGTGYYVWCAVGTKSNRLLYAAKRSKVENMVADVVEPPPLEDPEEDVELTYGNSVQGIQLVP